MARALKLVSLAETGPASFERARREARILATASHPALVTFHGFFEDPRAGIVGLVMDLVTGQSLTAAASGGRLDRARAAAALAQLAGALAYIHGAGLVHRDLKPDNVLVTEGFWEDADRPGTVKLVDFGIAAAATNPDTLTAAGHVIGTLPYLSPELIDPATWGRAEGPARDVFAFGVLAHELRFGRHPTGLGSSATMIDFARAYKAAEVQRLRWPPVSIKDAADAFIARCLALRPADRPRDGAEVVALMQAGGGPAAAAWSGMFGPTAPHRTVTESSRVPKGTPPSAERTAPMGVERTVPAGPMPAAVTASPGRSRRGGSVTIVVLAALLGAVVGALALAAVLLGRERAPEPIVSPLPVPQPSLTLPPAPTQVSTNFGACCRDDTCTRQLSRFFCPVCTGDPPPLPKRMWWMRIGGVTDHLSANQICARVAGADQPERCMPYARIPDYTGASGRLQVTTDDVESGRVFFTLKGANGPLASGYGHRKLGNRFLASALCMGLSLHVDVPGSDDVLISIYLDDR